MKILLWHVHGSWTTAFLQGAHEYVVPVVPDRGPDGLGLATTYDWPAAVREVAPERLRDEEFDLVLLQRPRDLELAEQWLGQRLGADGDLPAVWLEHNTPKPGVLDTRHPLADRSDVPLVHVTHFNELFWDSGRAPTHVIEHGVVDPGPLYTGELPRAAVAINEPVRRWRVTGTDLLPGFARAAPLDVFGMRTEGLAGHLDVAADRLTAHELPQRDLHAAMARRRAYLHPIRWTSLGLSLLEAMHLAMPVVVLATTEAVEAVPAGAGVVSTRTGVLADALRRFVADPDEARATGLAARRAVLARYSLARFLGDWDALLQEVVR